ncbi:MAG: COX15/CtaA family protein [Pseudomonadota bacterium]
MNSIIFNLSRVAVVLALFVIVVGAYTRLSHAGLGCPDWPGCYGQLLVPETDAAVSAANEAYPERPLERDKAWIEMGHRYIAGILGLLILAICAISWIKKTDSQTRFFASGLLLLVIFQALLGMWTVTLLLKPFVVLLHLLGGMSIVSMLYWLSLHQRSKMRLTIPVSNEALLPWSVFGIIIVVLQISLGGWTSTNYAALACPDFPSCHGVMWPEMNFGEAFVMWRGLGIDYEGGVLDGPARTAIHMAHRIGAILTLVCVSVVAIKAILQEVKQIRLAGIAIFVILGIQLSLGVANVVMTLPLYIAVAHNGVAALLLLSLVTLLHLSISKQIRVN